MAGVPREVTRLLDTIDTRLTLLHREALGHGQGPDVAKSLTLATIADLAVLRRVLTTSFEPV